MLNRDITARFEDWLRNPIEGLDFEVKGWLNLEDAEARGTVAKALIALENHGGGFLLFGYRESADKSLEPDPNRPASLEPYLSDSINSIVKKRAEPSFHVDVTIQRHPETQFEYPLVRISGTSKVPVRSDSETKGSLRNFTYYIRAAGPESRGPTSSAEWDTLLRRAVLNQRDEIVSVLRTFSQPHDGARNEPAELRELSKFSAEAVSRWKGLNDSLPEDHPAKVKLGHFSFSARSIGTSRNLSAKQIQDLNQQGRRYTGWPVFITLYHGDTHPYVFDKCLEAWTAKSRAPDVGQADFWRIRPDGFFYLLRGHQEDSLDASKGFANPGKSFGTVLPVWRLGEFLLRVAELSDSMFEPGYALEVQCEWTGLAGRELVSTQAGEFYGGGRAVQDCVQTSGRYAGSVRDVLPEIVFELTQPLYEAFSMFQLEREVYQQQLSKMSGAKY